MRRILLASAVMALAGCNKPGHADLPVEVQASAAAGAAAANTIEAAVPAGTPGKVTFDPGTVPVAKSDLGAFPFLEIPQGFTAMEPKQLALEQKYFFPGDRVRTVEGMYYHADLFADGGLWNETLLMRSFDRKIAELGGVQVFDGPLPEAARTLIDERRPRFVDDLYDPSPYRFRQYLIRTADRAIWIELGYGYNAEMVDLTVVQEEAGAPTT